MNSGQIYSSNTALSRKRVIAPYPPENEDSFAILFSALRCDFRISAKKTVCRFLGSGDNGAITHKTDSAINPEEKCKLCGSLNLIPIHKSESWSLQKCRDCSILFIDPFPSPDATRDLYEKDLLHNSKYYDVNRKDDLVSFEKRLALMEKYLPEFRKSLFILDYGCSTGNFMEAACSKGHLAEGVELNCNSADICKKKGFKVNELSQEKYDLVHAGDIIEHVQDPVTFLGELHSKLKEKGLLAISTPDIGKWITRRTQVKPMEHLFYFTKDTLRNILGKNGFEVLYLDNFSRQRSISSLGFSSTSQKSTIKIALGLLNTLHLNGPVDWIISNFNDDLLAIARRKSYPGEN